MKKNIYGFIFLFIASYSYSQFPAYVKSIDAKPNKITTIKDNLSTGKVTSDLSWASKSRTACFPATQNSKFTGNHVLYSTNLPEYSEMFITVIPDNKNANMSIYAYSIGASNYKIPPALSSCVSCEADHKWDRPRKGKTQDHTRSISLNAINNPYKVVIGVCGADGLTKGTYVLKIKVE